MTRYVVLDVFTDTAFGGNPLAVIPDATALPEETLQKIAREFGFSETTFVYPPAEAGHTARVRIFTPASEIPFAGHPTIGTAVALARDGAAPEMVLELGVGPIRAWVEGDAARFVTEVPLTLGAEPEPALVAACAGLDMRDLELARHRPVVASVGLPFVLAELSGHDALARAAPDRAAFARAEAAHPTGIDLFALLLYVRRGGEVRARMFAPLINVPEDPATGSAAAALAAFLASREGDLDLTLHQGLEMGRPSRIDLSVRGGAVTVGGRAVPVMEGHLVLPGLPANLVTP
ncbi:PhzF family phenazine biosynthesis protein [Roseitranquillus sediminis]|uniref:PhzF family phenazine biosynthesis protein n=1 Tax=Roseitranquillus sediminis TaxID=2809051 RepID=UPI001D0C46B3|nr:PhzF family phenazine biosynthesis protein [Roseitranquillus sediminis]MBM9596075.1 PhzF family phenazine biosynthesis protein [Roseitranquillus sediminis]